MPSLDSLLILWLCCSVLISAHSGAQWDMDKEQLESTLHRALSKIAPNSQALERSFKPSRPRESAVVDSSLEKEDEGAPEQEIEDEVEPWEYGLNHPDNNKWGDVTQPDGMGEFQAGEWTTHKSAADARQDFLHNFLVSQAEQDKTWEAHVEKAKRGMSVKNYYSRLPAHANLPAAIIPDAYKGYIDEHSQSQQDFIYTKDPALKGVMGFVQSAADHVPQGLMMGLTGKNIRGHAKMAKHVVKKTKQAKEKLDKKVASVKSATKAIAADPKQAAGKVVKAAAAATMGKSSGLKRAIDKKVDGSQSGLEKQEQVLDMQDKMNELQEQMLTLQNQMQRIISDY